MKVVKVDDNFLSQIMSVNIPQDQSMGRAYDYLNDNAIAPMEGNESWKKNPAGHPDSSYAEAERQAGKAVTGYVNKALAPKNPVHGEDGSRPVSEPDQTTGKLIPAIFQNMDNETVGRAIQEFNEAQGYTYDPKHGSRQAYSFEKGMKMAPLEAKTAFYSFASLMGEMVYGMTGGCLLYTSWLLNGLSVFWIVNRLSRLNRMQRYWILFLAGFSSKTFISITLQIPPF